MQLPKTVTESGEKLLPSCPPYTVPMTHTLYDKRKLQSIEDFDCAHFTSNPKVDNEHDSHHSHRRFSTPKDFSIGFFFLKSFSGRTKTSSKYTLESLERRISR
jgi:hypothetical protein